jgi:uncharacterized protein YkwD
MSYLLLVAMLVSANENKQDLSNYSNCGLNEKAMQLAQMLVESKIQQRSNLICNSQLAAAASQKARVMAEKEKVLHNLNNTSPNELLKNNGIVLPLYYAKIGNQVESVLGGMQTAEESYQLFMTSETHKKHLLGENNFYQQQTQIGVGYYFDKKTKHMDYWVVYITALKNDSEEYHVGMNIRPDTLKFKIIKTKKRPQMPGRQW